MLYFIALDLFKHFFGNHLFLDCVHWLFVYAQAFFKLKYSLLRIATQLEMSLGQVLVG